MGVREIVTRYASEITDPRIFFQPNIPSKKLTNALRAYARDVKPEDVLVLVDSTTFGSAKDGAILTETDLYGHRMMQEPVSVKLSSIEEFSYTWSGSTTVMLGINGNPFVEMELERGPGETFRFMLKDVVGTFHPMTDDIDPVLRQAFESMDPEGFAERLRAKNDTAGLVNALSHSSEEIRAAALRVINKLDFRALGVLTQFGMEFRVDSVIAVKLMKLLRGDMLSQEMFVGAAEALAKIKSPTAIGDLVSHLDRHKYLTGPWSKTSPALVECCRAMGEEAIDVLLEHLSKHQDCETALETLREIGGERAHDAWVLALQHYCEHCGLGVSHEIGSCVYAFERIGVRPSALGPLRDSLEIVRRELATPAAPGGYLMTMTDHRPKLIASIEKLIRQVQPEED
jgi:hypothetical protein